MCKETALLQTLVCGSARGVCKCAVLCVGSSFKCYPNPNCPSGQKWEGKNKFLQTDSVYLFMLIVCFSTLLLTVCKQAYTANLQLYCQGTTLSGSYACLLLCGVFLSSFDTYPFSRFNVIRFTVQYTVKATTPVRETKNNSLIPKLGSQNTNPKISPEIRQSIPVN